MVKHDNIKTMGGQLAIEEVNKPVVARLFKGHRIKDISSSLKERKSGTDFLLSICNPAGAEHLPIRCENKFDQHTTGNVVLELVSVDRHKVPGWMYTSQAGWLFNWFRNTGDLFVCPLADVRELVLPKITRHLSTTTRNGDYLSWSVLEDMNYLLLNLKNSRVLNLRHELSDKPEQPSRVSFKARHKRCKVEELLELMTSLPPASTPPGAPTSLQLDEVMRRLAPLNLKAEYHADLIRLA
jgi:hypothetical protein